MTGALVTGVELFGARAPVPGGAGFWRSNAAELNVVKVTTDAGVTGWSFQGPAAQHWPEVAPLVVGRSVFAIDEMLQLGLERWGGVEHALWDAAGKLCGQPVHRMLGTARDRVKAYLTCVWDGPPDQSHVSPREQAEMAVSVRDAGFKGMKVRAWRPDPMDDVRAVAAMREAAGEALEVMVDRTGDRSGTVWDYATALEVARELERLGVLWLEEPFAEQDLDSPARLRDDVGITITGGEPWTGFGPFSAALRRGSYDIVQPDAAWCGGLLMATRIASAASALGAGCILHGAGGPRVMGYLHASAVIGAGWQELGIVAPPLLPEEMWAQAFALAGPGGLRFEDGYVVLPDVPGIGLAPDVAALERCRVR